MTAPDFPTTQWRINMTSSNLPPDISPEVLLKVTRTVAEHYNHPPEYIARAVLAVVTPILRAEGGQAESAFWHHRGMVEGAREVIGDMEKRSHMTYYSNALKVARGALARIEKGAGA